MGIRLPNIGRAVAKIMPAVRAIDETSLTDRASVLRSLAAVEGDKGEDLNDIYPDDWVVIATDIPCSIEPAIRRSSEQEAGGRLGAVGDYTVKIPISSFPIKPAYRIRLISRANLDLEVVKEVQQRIVILREIECKEVV
jgi:hypothetical protein